MKRINLVLVLLLTLSLASSQLLVPSAQAGEVKDPDTEKPDSIGDLLGDLQGDPDDDGKGDPGSMGDGNGVDGGVVAIIGPNGSQSADQAALEEYLLRLMLLAYKLIP
jgi:hypothetical protein